MAGANYMGGRRNAARARVKDTDSRLQKSHFGKQRLTILAKGLGKGVGAISKRAPPTSNPRGAGVPELSLAHARRGPELLHGGRSECGPTRVHAYIRERTPESPAKRRRPDKAPPDAQLGNGLNNTTSRSHKRPSRILRELDKSDPFTTRAQINRLLSQPDFAGLAQLEARHGDTSLLASSPRPPSPYPKVSGSPEGWDQIHTERSAEPSSRSALTSPIFTEPNERFAPTSNSSRCGTPEENICRDLDFEPIPFDDDASYPGGFQQEEYVADPSSCEATLIDASEDVTVPVACFSGPSPVWTVRHGWPARASPARRESPHRLSSVHRMRGSLLSSPSSTDRFFMPATPQKAPSTSWHTRRLPGSPGCERTPPRLASRTDGNTFLDRIVAKYPLTSASVFSGDSVFGDVFSSSRPSVGSASFSLQEVDLDSARFISDFASRSPSPVTHGSTATQQTLLVAVQGELFEHSDPWSAIRGRLQPSSPTEGPQERMMGNEDAFAELRHVFDRRGVGFVRFAAQVPPISEEPYATPVRAAQDDQLKTSVESLPDTDAYAPDLVEAIPQHEFEAVRHLPDSPPVHCVLPPMNGGPLSPATTLTPTSQSNLVEVVPNGPLLEPASRCDASPPLKPADDNATATPFVDGNVAVIDGVLNSQRSPIASRQESKPSFVVGPLLFSDDGGGDET